MSCSRFSLWLDFRSRSYPYRGWELACRSLCVILIDLVEVSWVLFPFFLVALWTCFWVKWFACWLWTLFGSFWVSIFVLLDLSRMAEPIYELSRSLSFTKRFDRVLISRLTSSRRLVMFYLRQPIPGGRLKNWNCSVSWILKAWSTGLLIAWAILYRRSHKPEVLALDSILALSRSKGFIWSHRALLFTVL